MEKNNLTLNEVYKFIWTELKEGSQNRKHPFHLCFLSTVSLENVGAESRIVVLREVDSNNFLIRCNCDIRSNKANEIKRNPNTALLFYNQDKKIQVRIKARSEIVNDEKSVKPIWDASQEISRRCYFSPPPSSILDAPFNNDLLDLESKDLGINVFGLIISKAYEIDYLELDYNGHMRCKFIIEKEKIIEGNWISP